MHTEHYADAIHFMFKKCPQRAILVYGPTGIGKSDIPVSISKQNNLPLVYADCTGMEPTDLTGLPEKDKQEMIVRYFSLEMFKPLYTEPRGIFVLDELTRLDLQVRHTIMPVLVRRVLPSGQKINDGWLLIGTANPQDEDYQVAELDKALLRRMIVVPLSFNLNAWREWGVNHGISGRVLTAAGRLSGTLNRTIDKPMEQICTPFGLEVVSDLIKAGVHELDPELEFTLLSGAVGDTAAGVIQKDLNDEAMNKLLQKALAGEKIDAPHDQMVNLVYLFWEEAQKDIKKHIDATTNLYNCLSNDIRMLLVRIAYDRMVQFPEDFGKVIDQWSDWCTQQLKVLGMIQKKKRQLGGI